MKRDFAFKLFSLNAFYEGFATAFTPAKRGVFSLTAILGTATTHACYFAIGCRPRRGFNTNNFVFCAAVGTFAAAFILRRWKVRSDKTENLRASLIILGVVGLLLVVWRCVRQ
jgi:uncharacterized membrane protein YeaQ/YmgE (transglycosylase-associated protein family)